MLYTGYRCDGCGISFEFKADSKEWLPGKTDLVRSARNKGWSIGRKVLCPECKLIKKL